MPSDRVEAIFNQMERGDLLAPEPALCLRRCHAGISRLVELLLEAGRADGACSLAEELARVPAAVRRWKGHGGPPWVPAGLGRRRRRRARTRCVGQLGAQLRQHERDAAAPPRARGRRARREREGGGDGRVVGGGELRR